MRSLCLDKLIGNAAGRRCAAALLLWLVVAFGRPVSAQVRTWIESSGDGAWSVPGNWAGGLVANGTGVIADFGALDIPVNNTIRLNLPITVGHLHFGDVVPTHNWTLTNNGESGNVLTMAVSAGVPTITVSNQAATITANLAGQGIQKLGSGNLRLTGNNTYAGGTYLYQGTLEILSDSNLGGPTSNLLINGGVLHAVVPVSVTRPVILEGAGGTIDTPSGQSEFSGGIGNSGSLTKTGAGALRLSSPNSYAGGTFVNAGTMIFNYAPNVVPVSGAISVSTGAKVSLETAGQGNFGFGTFGNLIALSHASTLEFRSNLGGTGNFSQSVWFGNVTLAGDPTIATNAGPNTVGRIDGVMSGSGNLNVSGFVRLANANTFTGQTRIQGGALLLAHANALAGSTLHMHASDEGQIGFEGITSATVGSLVGARNIALQNNNGQPVALTIGVNNSDNTYTGQFTGTGSVVKAGTGTHYLRGASTYSGGTTIYAGALNVASDSNLGSSVVLAPLTLGGGTLQAGAQFTSSRPVVLGSAGGTIDTNGFNPIFLGNISGSGALTKTGAGTLRMTPTAGLNTYSDGTTISAGTLTVSPSGFSQTGNVTVATGATLNLETTGPVVEGFGTFGQLVSLSHASTLEFSNMPGNQSAINALIADVSLAGNVTFRNAGPVLVGEIRRSIGGSGNLFVDGIIKISFATSFTGQTQIDNGQLRIAHPHALFNSTLNLAPGDSGTISFDATLTETTLGGLQGTRNLLLQNDAAQPIALKVGNNNIASEYSGQLNGTGALVKIGTAALTLSGMNSHSGGTAINGGSIFFDSDGNFGTGDISFDGGSLYATAGMLGATVNLNKSITLNSSGGILNSNTHNLNQYGPISGIGALAKGGAGTLILHAGNPFSGDTRILEGTLLIANADAISNSTLNMASFDSGTLSFATPTVRLGGLKGTRNILLQELPAEGGLPVAMSVGFANAGTMDYSGVLSGPGSLTKTGTGTLVLSAAQTYTGGTTIDGGRLAVDGSIPGPVTVNFGGTLAGDGTVYGNVAGDGRVAPGNSPGILTIDGDYTQSDDSVLEIEIGGLTPGNDNNNHDQVLVGGVATLGGVYEFQLFNGFVPQAGQAITFIDTFSGGSVAAGTRPRAITAPGLDAANPDLAIRVVATPGVGGNVQLEFVPESEIFYDGDGVNANWFIAGTDTNWDQSRNPGFADRTTVEYVSGAPQVVSINSVDPVTLEPVALVNELVVGEASGNGIGDITVAVESGFELEVRVGNVTIADRGIVEVDDNSVVRAAASTQVVDVQSGGMLAGNGTVQAGTLSVSGGTLRPGFSVGHLDVEGNYEQGTAGTLLVDIEGPTQFDTVVVTGDVELGGTLRIDASNLTTASDGAFYQIVTAGGGLSGSFASLEVVGNNDVYFREFSDEAGGGAGVQQLTRGDMNGTGWPPDNEDYRLFVFALMNVNSQSYDYNEWFATCGAPCLENPDLAAIFPEQGGDFNGNGRVDFDDIGGFQNHLGGMGVSSAGLSAAFDRYFNQVPEPSTGWLIFCGTSVLMVAGRRSIDI